jgi:multidrug efflux pump subunit AcrA (membrane-fusion protein)
VRNLAQEAVGPKHWIVKLIVIAVLAALVFLFQPWYLANYTVSAQFQFMPVERRQLDAPFEGVLESLGTINGKPVKPGMAVKKGDLLAKMKTLELEDQLAQARARQYAAEAEARKYLTDPDKAAEAEQARYQALSAKAEGDGYQHRIDRASIKAPMDGQVLEGDLTDRVGGAVKEGDKLFVVGPIDNLEAELTVADRDIQDVVSSMKPGDEKTGELATTSLPSEKFSFTVERIVPMGEPKEGENAFKVYAKLKQNNANWRPGLRGEAKIDIRQEKWAWVWTHRFANFVTLKWWSWSPF